MIDIDGTCRDCKKSFTICVHNDICFTCDHKEQLDFFNKQKLVIENEIESLHKRLRPTKMKKIKLFTWWMLLVFPLATFIGCYFGTGYQHAFNVGIIAAPIASFLADYLNEKF